MRIEILVLANPEADERKKQGLPISNLKIRKPLFLFTTVYT